MYSVKNDRVYNWPPSISPCKQGCPYNKNCSCGVSCKCGPDCKCSNKTESNQSECGPQYPNNQPLCPFKGINRPCGSNCFQGTGNCPRRLNYDDQLQAKPLNGVPNNCVYQGKTLQGNPTFGYRKPIPLPFVVYNRSDERSPYDNQPGCLSFIGRGPF